MLLLNITWGTTICYELYIIHTEMCCIHSIHQCVNCTHDRRRHQTSPHYYTTVRIRILLFLPHTPKQITVHFLGRTCEMGNSSTIFTLSMALDGLKLNWLKKSVRYCKCARNKEQLLKRYVGEADNDCDDDHWLLSIWTTVKTLCSVGVLTFAKVICV